MATLRPYVWTPGRSVVGDQYERDASYTNHREHGSGDCLLIYTHSGAGRFVAASGASVITRAGDAVLYVPKEMQDYSTDPRTGKWNFYWVHFPPKPHWQVWLNWPVNRHGLRLLHLEGELRDRFRAAFREMILLRLRQIPEANDLAANAVEKMLLWAHASGSDRKWRSIDARVRQAADYLVAHYQEPFRMETLARHCRISPSRLSHLFKAEMQVPPQQFLEKCRIQQACDLLRITRRSIAEIAAEVGYDDAFYFANRFRRQTGRSPSRFRAEAEL